jgi:hypothetical protein
MKESEMSGSESAGTIGELKRGKMTTSRTGTRDSQPVVFEITKTINIVAVRLEPAIRLEGQYTGPRLFVP